MNSGFANFEKALRRSLKEIERAIPSIRDEYAKAYNSKDYDHQLCVKLVRAKNEIEEILEARCEEEV